MNNPSHQISIMARESDLCRFWANSYGLVSDTFSTVYLGDVIDEYGYQYLFDKIETDIIKYNASLLLIDVSAVALDPFVIFDLKKKYGFMVVLLAIDDEMKFTWISSSYSTIADLVITSDYISVQRYRQSGVNAHFLPLPVYIPEEMPVRQEELGYQVSFIGRRDRDKPIREKYLGILEKEIGLSIFGNKGGNDPEYLSTDAMYSIFRNSQINLNFTGITVYDHSDNALHGRIRGMKIRPMEIFAAGGMCLSEFSISLAKCFEDGKDIVFFNSEHDMLKKIKYYLEHKEESRIIAAAGRAKIIEEYSGDAIAAKLKTLIQQSKKYKGVDLFSTPHEVKVTRWFAYSFIELILTKMLTFLFRGKFYIFLCDSVYLLKFVRSLPENIGLSATLQVIAMGVYRAIKTLMARVKSWRVPNR